MSGERRRLPHEDRTATEPREKDVHDVILNNIENFNQSVKLFKLKVKDEKNGVKFAPGQWLDVFIPSLPKAGGFTLTSIPGQALPPHPVLELAIQRSPDNPPAAWLWRKPSSILGSELKVRVGGSFTWPPFGWQKREVEEIEKVVFVAGGVGINPLISMLTHMHVTDTMPLKVEFLYSTKPALTEKQNINPSAVLFLSRLTRIASERPNQFDLTLFVTNQEYQKIKDPQALGWFHDRRISEVDLLAALGLDVNMRAKTVCYVCGPPKMTDQTVAFLGRQGGMDMERVFCEKWW